MTLNWLTSIDPWALLSGVLFVLWIVEVRFGSRHKYMAGKLAGYDLAAKQSRIATADEPPALAAVAE